MKGTLVEHLWWPITALGAGNTLGRVNRDVPPVGIRSVSNRYKTPLKALGNFIILYLSLYLFYFILILGLFLFLSSFEDV